MYGVQMKIRRVRIRIRSRTATIIRIQVRRQMTAVRMAAIRMAAVRRIRTAHTGTRQMQMAHTAARQTRMVHMEVRQTQMARTAVRQIPTVHMETARPIGTAHIRMHSIRLAARRMVQSMATAIYMEVLITNRLVGILTAMQRHRKKKSVQKSARKRRQTALLAVISA